MSAEVKPFRTERRKSGFGVHFALLGVESELFWELDLLFV